MTRFAHALFGIVPAWRDLCDRRLPLWGFLGRRARVARLHALRCQACDLRPRCKRRVSSGSSRPARGCPNAELFH